jgi:hypothetical protein
MDKINFVIFIKSGLVHKFFLAFAHIIVSW